MCFLEVYLFADFFFFTAAVYYIVPLGDTL